MGLPGFDVMSWYGFFVPVKTPAAIVKKMHDDTVAILAEPGHEGAAGAARRCRHRSTPEVLAPSSSRNGDVGADHQGIRHQG